MNAVHCDKEGCNRWAENGGGSSQVFVTVSGAGLPDEHYCSRRHAALGLIADSQPEGVAA